MTNDSVDIDLRPYKTFLHRSDMKNIALKNNCDKSVVSRVFHGKYRNTPKSEKILDDLIDMINFRKALIQQKKQRISE